MGSGRCASWPRAGMAPHNRRPRRLPSMMDLGLLVEAVIQHDPRDAGVREAAAGKNLQDRDPQLRDGLRVAEDRDELVVGFVAQGGHEAMLAVQGDLHARGPPVLLEARRVLEGPEAGPDAEREKTAGFRGLELHPLADARARYTFRPGSRGHELGEVAGAESVILRRRQRRACRGLEPLMSLSPLPIALEIAPRAVFPRGQIVEALLEEPGDGADGDVVRQGRLEILERPQPSIAVAPESLARCGDLDLRRRDAVRSDGDGSFLDGAAPHGAGREAIDEGEGRRLDVVAH